MFDVQIIRTFDEKTVKNIVDINERSFPPQWAYPDAVDYYTEMLKDNRVIHIMLEWDEERVGYLMAMPSSMAVAELKEFDPAIRCDFAMYYIETVGIIPAYRGMKGLPMMMGSLIAQCQTRAIQRIALHARVTTGLSRMLQKNMKMLVVRRIERWRFYNYEEPTDYIEMQI